MFLQILANAEILGLSESGIVIHTRFLDLEKGVLTVSFFGTTFAITESYDDIEIRVIEENIAHEIWIRRDHTPNQVMTEGSIGTVRSDSLDMFVIQQGETGTILQVADYEDTNTSLFYQLLNEKIEFKVSN